MSNGKENDLITNKWMHYHQQKKNNIVMRYIIEKKTENNLDVNSETRVVTFMALELVNAWCFGSNDALYLALLWGQQARK